LLRAAADRQLGLVTAADVRRAGYDHVEVRRLCSSGRWTRLRRGVYVASDQIPPDADPAARPRLDCLALLLHLGRPRAALSHGTAARVRGLPVPAGLAPTIRLTDPDRWRRGDDFLMSRAPLRPGEVVTRGPLRLTSVARTLVDCAREWPLEEAV